MVISWPTATLDVAVWWNVPGLYFYMDFSCPPVRQYYLGGHWAMSVHKFAFAVDCSWGAPGGQLREERLCFPRADWDTLVFQEFTLVDELAAVANVSSLSADDTSSICKLRKPSTSWTCVSSHLGQGPGSPEGSNGTASHARHLANLPGTPEGHRVQETVTFFPLWPHPEMIITVAVEPDPTLLPAPRQRFFLCQPESEQVFRVLGCPEPHRTRWLELASEQAPGWQDFLAGPGWSAAPRAGTLFSHRCPGPRVALERALIARSTATGGWQCGCGRSPRAPRQGPGCPAPPASDGAVHGRGGRLCSVRLPCDAGNRHLAPGVRQVAVSRMPGEANRTQAATASVNRSSLADSRRCRAASGPAAGAKGAAAAGTAIPPLRWIGQSARSRATRGPTRQRCEKSVPAGTVATSRARPGSPASSQGPVATPTPASGCGAVPDSPGRRLL